MKKVYSYFQTCLVLYVIFFITSCNGQVKNPLSREQASESNASPVRQSTLLKAKSTNEGDNVHNSLQDKSGNLWFGTTGDGVYKYDGKSFTQFTSENGLNSNTIWCIFEDKDGKIWIGTEAGVCIYDGKSFVKMKITSPNDPLYNRYDVFSIINDRSGKLWIATVNGVYIYDGKSYTPFVVNEGAQGYRSDKNNVEYILEDKDGNIWFGGRVNEGVFRYDGKSITNIKLTGQKSHNWAWPQLQDNDGNIWFSNWDGAYRYDGKTFTRFSKEDGLASDAVMRMMKDKNGNLWFGCGSDNGGICRYDGKSFTCYTTKEGLINKGIWSIMEDDTGNLWVGTRETGLFHYDGKNFTRFSEKKVSFFPEY